MNKAKRIKQARYFLRCLDQVSDDRFLLECHLSAFLMSARSVLQYVFEEVRGTRESLNWYEHKKANDNVLCFMGRVRNEDMHEEPLKTKGVLTVVHRASYAVTGVEGNSDPAARRRESTAPGGQSGSANIENGRARTPAEEPESGLKWYFDDWEGPEDLVTLCEEYLKRVEAFVVEGRELGHINQLPEQCLTNLSR